MTYSGSQAQAGRGSSLSIGGVLSITGNTTSGSSSVVSVSSTVGIAVGAPVVGAGIPAGTVVDAIGSGTLTLSANATATGTAVALTVGAAVGEVKSAAFAGGKWDTADVTNFESGSVREFITTILDNGSVDIEGNRVSSDAGQEAVEAAYVAGSIVLYQLMLPKTPTQTLSGDRLTFNALVESRNFDVDVTKEINWKVTLKISGAVGFTAGT